MTISSFKGEYRFLSNFWPALVLYDGYVYRSVEYAYQAAKTFDPDERLAIRNAENPKQAKHLGYKVTLRSDWEKVRTKVMAELLWQKFALHPKLKAALLNTGHRELIEGNTWHDNFWGSCSCENCTPGKNMLGKLLMRIRAKLYE